MSKVSRPKTRRLLVQCLYAYHIHQQEQGKKDILDRFFAEDARDFCDEGYFSELYTQIPAKQNELLAIIHHFASKFDLATVPAMHLIILSISIYELLFFSGDDIPENVAINEGIELAKRFSDAHSKNFVNGILDAVKKNKETLKTGEMKIVPEEFLLFPSKIECK